MTVLLQLILITVMIVLALRVAISNGMILEKVGIYAEAKVEQGYKVWDLICCPWCAGTWISIVAHGFAFGIGVLPVEFNWSLLIRWPLVVFGASFTSGMLWTIYLTLNSIKENNDKKE